MHKKALTESGAQHSRHWKKARTKASRKLHNRQGTHVHQSVENEPRMHYGTHLTQVNEEPDQAENHE